MSARKRIYCYHKVDGMEVSGSKSMEVNKTVEESNIEKWWAWRDLNPKNIGDISRLTKNPANSPFFSLLCHDLVGISHSFVCEDFHCVGFVGAGSEI